ncbi:hypothetical protein KP509_11G036900 [Ceratopteris richardii]|uniref:BED-type domain-containing protein n=1 Tax=Ceratopteris richardii TaxID=49495 RepID=A0A8T2TUF7_CERRI|nr:hypothetical protein KP509_11G036900 [Ceratopteris richardii]
MPRGISPLWGIHTTHNELVNNTSSGSGTRRWACKYCGKQFSTRTTRLIRHVSGLGGSGISGCTEVPEDIAEIVRKEHKLSQDAAMARRREFLAASQDILEEVEEIGQSASTLKSRTSSVRDENEGFNPSEEHSSKKFKASHSSLHSTFLSTGLLKQRQRVADIEIERCILECNIPFNVVRTDAWKRMVKAIAQAGPSDDWHGVDYKRLRTSMLIEEKERIENLLEPIKLGWQTYGCSILSDGWSDIRHRHIINIMVSSCLGTYFLKAIDCSRAGTRITGEFIFEHIKASIEEIGVQNVVQVITDNASNCKRMGELVEAKFPSIVWSPCAAHCLDLLIEDIGKLSWLSPLVSDAKKVISFIRKNHQALAIFRAYSEKELIRPAETRFGYVYHVFARLHVCMDSLRMTVVDPRWRSMARGRTERANFVQRKIFDMDFWAEIECIMPILRPIHIVLRFADMEGSTLGLLYHMYTRMQEAISSVTTLSTSRLRDVTELVELRWQFLSRPIHSFAALLHPYFKGPRLWSQPHMRHMKDLYMDRIMSPDQQVTFDSEFSAYMSNVGIAYARSTSLRSDVTARPLEWWNHYGYGHPSIAPYALRVLSQDCSSSPCERNWSAFSLVHTKLRNRLSVEQFHRVVFCKANLRLLRTLRSLTGPKQTSPIDFESAFTSAEVCIEASILDEQDQVYRMLHAELESIDRRVTRARSRATSRPQRDPPEEGPSTSAAPVYTRRRKMRPRRRGQPIVLEAQLEDIVEDAPEDHEFAEMVPTVEPEYDDEGNVIPRDDISLSSSEDSFGIDDLE